jgi:hypothetical protein
MLTEYKRHREAPELALLLDDPGRFSISPKSISMVSSTTTLASECTWIARVSQSL